MDLDKIKESWNRPDIPVHTDEGKIRDIIRSKAKTALDRLVATETWLLFVVAPLIFVPSILDYFFGQLYTFPFLIKSAYIIFCVIGLFWQMYKRKLLKKIDIVNTGIVTCRKYFLKYKLCIKSEVIAGVIIFLVLYSAFVYSWKEIMTPYRFEVYCWLNAVFVLVMLILLLYTYKKLYYKQIRKIETSLNEIEEIEKE